MPTFQQFQLSRRTILRGAGVAMALPWLESIPVWGAEPTSAEQSAYPKRFAALYGVRRQCNALVGQRQRQRNGARQIAGAALGPEEEAQRDQRPVQPGGG